MSGDSSRHHVARRAPAGIACTSPSPAYGWPLVSDGPGGDLVAADRKVKLKIRVQCPNWLDVDRVQVFVNGRPLPKLNFTRKDNPDAFQNGVVKFERKDKTRKKVSVYPKEQTGS